MIDPAIKGGIRMQRFYLTAGAMLLLAGCATLPVQPSVDTPGMANPEAALQRSMARVDSAMTALGGMRVASHAAGQVVPSELQKPVSLTWSGPLDEAARALAEQVGYRFVATGPAAAPIPVAINAQNQPIVDLFRSLGSQAGSRATVAVDAQNHVVEVRHNA
jgi:defect-in-organelle-trafficking protein DotD